MCRLNAVSCRNLFTFGGRKLLALLVSLLCLAAAAWGQDTATIVGTVFDASGAVMPGVNVTVSNPERGFVRAVASNSAGEYAAARIPIGNYVITAEASGFQKLVRLGINLDAGQTQRVDLTMTVGQVTQEVQVTGNVSKVETESPTLSDVVTSKQIQNLTLNGLNFGALTFLVPGAVQQNGYTEAQQLGHNGAEVGVSFNGNRVEYSGLELDGGNNSQESSTAMGGAVTPAIDMIAEFRISTSDYGADVGQHAGALVEIATKGGTKDFHGDAYEFVRNDALDANDWFANQQINPPGGHAPKTPLKWNIFGYTLGGPFYIPGMYNTSKNKTFFFWSQEWARYRQAGSPVNQNVPTSLMRGGDFSQCDPASPNYVALLVQQGCVLPKVNGQTRDTVSVSPNGAAFLNAFVPLPNSGIEGYVAAHSVPTNFSQESIRVDQNISNKAALFVRFTNDGWTKTVVPALWTGSSFDTTATAYSVPARQTVLHLSYNFRPNLLNEFIMSYTDTPHTISPLAGPGSPAHSIKKPSDWNASTFFPANAGNPLLAGVYVTGGTPFPSFGVDSGNYRGPYDAEPVYVYKDNVAWTKGKHTFKFGFFLEKFQLTEQFGTETQGNYTFSNGSSVTTGNALADMYLGRIQQYYEGTFNAHGVYTGGYGVGHWRRTDFEPYFQDDWKVNRRLTLNFGVRYYLLIPPHDVTKPTVDSSFIPSFFNPAFQAPFGFPDGLLHPNPATGQIYDFTMFGNGLVECGAGPIAKGCQRIYYENIGPRFGFAFDPTGSGKTSIRGGYGIYYEAGNGNDANTIGLEGNAPTTLSPRIFNLTSFTFNTSGFAGVGPSGLQAIPYGQKNPAVTQINLNVQHEFRGNNVLTVAYVGTLGRHLDTGRNLNQIPVGVGTLNVPALASTNGGPCSVSGNCSVQQLLMTNQVAVDYFVPYQGYDRIQEKQFSAVSSYHALQTNLRHTTGYGLTLQAAYTWSHLIDNSTTAYFATYVDDNYNMNRWKGTSDLNRTQVFTANYIYSLPFFKNSSGFVKGALGGWQISGITNFFSGVPLDFSCGVAGYSTGIGTGVRCNTLGPLKIKKGTVIDPTFGPMVSWFDPAVLTQPLQSQLPANNQPGMFGYMGRNALTGPGRNNWDLALHKEFPLPWFKSEHSTLQFRVETFNTFNHPQWNQINVANVGCNGSPNADGSPAFGRTCGGSLNPNINEVSSAWNPRNIQLGMKFIF